MSEQKSKLIHAELKCGMHVKCLWLGNDAFAKLFESWDFDSDEGKFKGLAEFDSTFSYTFDFDELKDEKDLIGIDVEEGLKDAEIVSYDIEDINWDIDDGETIHTHDVDFSWIEIDEATATKLEEGKISEEEFLIEQVKNGNLYIVAITEVSDENI